MTSKLPHDTKRTLTIKIPVNKKEKALIEERARKAMAPLTDFSLAAYVRQVAMHGEIKK